MGEQESWEHQPQAGLDTDLLRAESYEASIAVAGFKRDLTIAWANRDFATLFEVDLTTVPGET